MIIFMTIRIKVPFNIYKQQDKFIIVQIHPDFRSIWTAFFGVQACTEVVPLLWDST